MTIFPGCKCCGPCGPCWRCYGKQDFPPVDCGGLIISSDYTKWSMNADSLGENPNGPGQNPPEEFINKDLLLRWLQSIAWKTKSYVDPSDPNVIKQEWESQSGGQPGSIADLGGCSSSFAPTPQGISIWPLEVFNPCGYMQFASSVGVGPKSYFGVIHSSMQEEQIMSLYCGDKIQRWSPDCENPNIFTNNFIAMIWSCKGRDDGAVNLWQYDINGAYINFTNDCIEDPSDPSDINFSDYQCFDAQPTEEGWLPVGDCHPDEESCAKECPPKPTIPICGCSGSVNGDAFESRSDVVVTLETNQYSQYVTCTESELADMFRVASEEIRPYLFDTAFADAALWSEYPLPPEYDDFVDQGGGTQSLFLQCGEGVPFPTKALIQVQEGTIMPDGKSCLSEAPVLIPGGVETGQPYAMYVDNRTTQPITVEQICNFSEGGSIVIPMESNLYGYWRPPTYPDRIYGSKVGVIFSERMFSSTTPGGRTVTQTKTGGPGTELAALLKTIGIDAKEKGCQCKSHAKRMDKEGPKWCRDNIETILGWLQTEAKKRKLPFIKTAAKQVVLLAIRRAEKKS